mgnify:CR=1 FL=1
MQMSNSRRVREHGAASLIVVIFSILLLVTVSLGFIRLVIRDQQRTIDDELSRGAYDAALAGVEDGKRILQACVAQGDAGACNAITANKCNSVHRAKILSAADSNSNEDEVFLKSSAGTAGETYDQAYTCVKVQRDTQSYEGKLTADTSRIIPLDTVGNFSQITVSWYKKPSLSVLNLPTVSTPTLPPLAEWVTGTNIVRPPIVRVQLIQYNNGNFNLDHFDQSGGGNTLYLYPANAGATSLSFVADGRRTGTDDLLKYVKCDDVTPYVCSVVLTLTDPVGGSAATRKAYLRVTSIFGDTQFSVQANGTMLHDVQPAVDATGRASDVFRRIKANVELESPFDIYPRATVDITKNFCKDFSVSADAYMPGSCDATQP